MELDILYEKKKRKGGRKRGKSSRKGAKLLQPTFVRGCKYEWGGLEVKACMAGLGVFATTVLRPGLMIPILGTHITANDAARLRRNGESTHVWAYQTRELVGKYIDGRPEMNRTGLNIAMLINESTNKIHNCIFKSDYVIVAKTIKPNEELTVYYGNEYARIDYSLHANKYLEYFYKTLDGLRLPGKKAENLVQWLQICE